MIVIKSKEQIQDIRTAGNIIKHTFHVLHDFLKEHSQKGISTETIDKLVHQIITKEGAEPVFLGYNGYPAVSCISINEEVIHGIPRKDKTFSSHDVVSIDIGVRFNGLYADSAKTFYLGNDEEILRLLYTTKTALAKGIAVAKANVSVLDISRAIQKHAEAENLGIVTEYCGHGVGVDLHEEPEIPNYYHRAFHKKLKKDMVIAIEPMFTLGTGSVRLAEDNFTVISDDNSMAAHFEHTILITEDGSEILT